MTQNFEQLLERFLHDQLDPVELKVFLHNVKMSENGEVIKEKLMQKLEARAYKGLSVGMDLDQKFQQMLNKAAQMHMEDYDPALIPIKQRKKSFNVKRIAIAASLLLALSTAGYFLLINKAEREEEMVRITEPGIDVKAPEANRAMITPADGRTIYLDSVANGTISQFGNVRIIKTEDGKIIYSGSSSNEVVYHTLSNPRGSKVIDMEMADGSHVWLNAGSSITYPVAFAGGTRNVSITGEAFFDITHERSKPFIVRKGKTSVIVLGTRFNINAYDNEDDIKITLLEGSVKVNSQVILKPGQQARVASTINVVSNVNVEEVMAWKNGLFDFNKTEIGEIMRQLERWYDMQVIYPAGKPNITLTGNISRHINISKVLQMLEMSGVKFSIDGKKIIVKR